jgi:hypothetical protein
MGCAPKAESEFIERLAIAAVFGVKGLLAADGLLRCAACGNRGRALAPKKPGSLLSFISAAARGEPAYERGDCKVPPKDCGCCIWRYWPKFWTNGLWMGSPSGVLEYPLM